MYCPECGSDDCKVVDSRFTERGTRRRRFCNACRHSFTTYEVVDKEYQEMNQKIKELTAFKNAICKVVKKGE